MPWLLLLLTLLVAVPADAKGTTSSDEVRFGIDVARRGLWREARFRFEKASRSSKKGSSRRPARPTSAR